MIFTLTPLSWVMCLPFITFLSRSQLSPAPLLNPAKSTIHLHISRPNYTLLGPPLLTFLSCSALCLLAFLSCFYSSFAGIPLMILLFLYQHSSRGSNLPLLAMISCLHTSFFIIHVLYFVFPLLAFPSWYHTSSFHFGVCHLSLVLFQLESSK